MFQDTRPAELQATGSADPWAEFRVNHPQERLRLLRALRDGGTPVMLNTPCGAALSTTLWAVDDQQQRLNFSAEPDAPQLPQLIEADETVAVAYLESVKLQFDLQAVTLVRGASTSALQCALPREIYRFQRRSAYRVRAPERHEPAATLRHPAMPEMQLNLRVLDVSIGGCALWLPADVPPLQAGTRIADVHVELDGETRFTAAITLQHVSALGPYAGSEAQKQAHQQPQQGARLGCEWYALPGSAGRVLQRWIDRAQQRRRLLAP
jgi:c-di-GMP-binding flagellar brake protein YcgR